MVEKWVVTVKGADFAGIGKKFGIEPVIARIIRNRDVIGDEAIEEYLHGGLENLNNPWLMKDLKKAVGILIEKIESGKKIRIIGDYDIDGVMSSYILLEALQICGAVVDVAIPNRIVDGYGLNERLMEQALADGVDTVLTCDNGIAAKDVIRLGKDQGMTVIVTDHHEVPYEVGENGERTQVLPGADAIVNPKQVDCGYPYKSLCGAAVAYKLVEVLFEERKPAGATIEDFLQYVAFATIGDVMDLTGENRILVKEGLKRLRENPNSGLLALMQVNQLEPRNIKAYHIGFILGPCLNASGRLDTAIRALRLLNAKNRVEATELAQDLLDLNVSRKEMTAKGVEEALLLAEEAIARGDRVLVLFLPNCHESLAGIIAGRVRERYNRPVFVLTKGEEGIKGSGRSIPAYSMFEEMSKCKELFRKYGGHPMAAGLSLSEENLEVLETRLNELCGLSSADLTPQVKIDVPLPVDYLSAGLVEELSVLEPFGKGNEKPVFADKNLQVRDVKILGKNRNVAKMQVQSSNGAVMEAMYFGDVAGFEGYQGKAMSFVYYPEINRFSGKETLQIVVKNFMETGGKES